MTDTTDKEFDIRRWARPHLQSLAGYVPGQQPQGGKFIKLNTNENPYPPSPLALAATGGQSEKLRKYPDPTATSFRRLAASQLGLSSQQVLCGNGSDELLSLIIRLFVGPGQTVRWPSPTYMLYEILVNIADGKPDPISFEADWKLNDKFFKGTPNLVFLANPNSPSGTCLDLDQLSTVLKQFDCPVVVDEAYADFAGQTAAKLLDRHANLIVTRTLSKSYALAGLRFGFLLASPKIVNLLHAIRDSYNCDVISIATATAAISDQTWLKQNIQTVLKTRIVLEDGLKNLGFDIQPSRANFVWCQHPHRSSQEIFEALKKRQILVRHMDYGTPWIGLRITVGTDQQNTVLLDQLEKILAG